MSVHIQNVPYSHSKGRGIPIEVVRLSELRAREMDIDISALTRHDFHMLMFVTSGSRAHWVDFSRHRLSEGDVLQVRPDQVHAFEADSTFEALLLVFRPEIVAESQAARLAVHLSRPVHLEPRDFDLLIQVIETPIQLEQVPERVRLSSMAAGLLQAVIVGLDDLYFSGEQAAGDSGGPAGLGTGSSIREAAPQTRRPAFACRVH